MCWKWMVDAVEERVNELKYQEEENTRNKAWRDKMIESKYRILKDIWNMGERSNIHIIGVSVGEEREMEQKK